MANNEADIKRSLSWRKMIIPLVLGLGAATYLFVNSLNQERYFKVESGAGTHIWVDSADKDGKKNGVIDSEIHEDFEAQTGGDFVYAKVSDKMSEIRWTSSVFFFLFLAFLTVLVRDLGYMYRIRVLTDKFFSWKESFQVIMLWELSSALTPSVVGGSGVAVFIMNREGLSLGKSTATMFVTALMDELFYIIMVPLVFLVAGSAGLWPDSIFGMEGDKIKWIFWAGYLFLCSLTIIIVLSLFFFPEGFKKLLTKIFSIKYLRRWIRHVVQLGNDIIISSAELKGKATSFWLRAAGSTFFSWTARFFTLNFVIMAFMCSWNNMNCLDHLYVYGRQLIMWIYVLIGITPGSSGIAEIALAAFFEDTVITAQYVAIVAIIWRALTYFPYLFIGSAVLPKWLSRTALKKAELKARA